MALRAVNVLLQDLARPEEILLCTYNRDAATELRERFENAASSAGYQGDTGRVRICTIHSLCGRLLAGHPERVGLRPNFRLQDEPQRWNLLHRRFDEVFGPDQRELKHRGWKDAPNVIRNALSYIDRICDELILPGDLIRSRSPFLAALGRCYRRYERLLLDENAADFAHLQAWADLLLDDDDIASELSGGIRFIQCDEFQDTSYIQERILRRLSEVHGNFCVVGDEDQSLYRFRGATARNILRFPHRFPDCKVVRLTVNYRSHPTIVKCYDRWMDSADWSNSDPQGPPYRHPKTILPHAPERYDDYPAVIAIAGRDPDDEGRQLADLLQFLKSRRVIAGYHQVALLLHTVKDEAASTYLDVLQGAGIPARCVPAGSSVGGAGQKRPPSAVTVTTIHQSKGREWPVVVVGSLDVDHRNVDPIGRTLARYCADSNWEPAHRIATFDRMRQHYVAFSRPQNLLILTASAPVHPRFSTIWDDLPRWAEMDWSSCAALARQRFPDAERSDRKRQASPDQRRMISVPGRLDVRINLHLHGA